MTSETLQTVVILGSDETHVTVGDDTDELAVLVHDRQAGDVETAAQLVEVSRGSRPGSTVSGSLDHAGFGTLDDG